MTEKEFITWIKGFVQGCDERGPTEKQWATIKNEVFKLGQSQINNYPPLYSGTTISTTGNIITATNKTILNG
jgi:hypothetical protein